MRIRDAGDHLARSLANAYTDLKAALEDPDHVFKEASFTGAVVDAMRQAPRAEVSDMPDGIDSRDGRVF